MAGPGAPCDPCAPVAVWKRHIVRQLRHRDRTQKALFLELVPACECVPGGSGMTGFEEVGFGERACPAARLVTQGSGAVLVPEGLASWKLLRLSLDRQTPCLRFPARVLLSPQDSALLPLSILHTSSITVLVWSRAWSVRLVPESS